MTTPPEPTFSILLPTRGRRARAERLLDSVAATAADPARVEVVLYLDQDDASSHGLGHPILRIVKLIRSPGQPMGRMTRACYEASRGQHVILMNDDVVFRTPGWDARVTTAFSRFPDGIALVYGNDLDQGRHVPSFPVLSRRACELLGGICPPGYWHLHIESHISDVFRQLARSGHDRRVYLEDVIFEHEHHVVGKAPSDATYEKRRDLTADEQLYFELAAERNQLAARLHAAIEDGGGPSEPRPPAPSIAAIVENPPARFATPRGRRRSITVVAARQPPVGTSGPPVSVDVRRVAVGPSVGAGGPSLLGALNARLGELVDDFVGFMRDEFEPPVGWLVAGINALRQDPALAVVGAKVIHRRNGRTLHAGIGFYEVRGLIRASHLYAGLPAGHPAVERERRCQAVSLVGMIARAGSIIEAGGFHEEFQSASLAAIDLCLRLRQRGGEILYLPSAVVEYDAPLDGDFTDEDEARLHARWRDRVLLDLPKLLQEDGLQLTVTADGLVVGPDTGR